MISDTIKSLRKKNNMSQEELAEKLGVSRQSVSLWETGQSQPTIENIVVLTKIFNVSFDSILGENENTEGDTPVINKEIPEDKKPNKKHSLVLLLTVIIALTVIVSVVLFVLLGKDNSDDSVDSNDQVVNSEYLSDTQTSTKPSESKAPVVNEKIDLFEYCKEFAIDKGNVNGDYCIYQQPATLYGGYQDEYFSISYWGDSDMVEFCLHCPLTETQSINFYLRMRGGYNHKYEYLTSKYYRDDGSSIRSASGYIDPKVFSNNYPLNCKEYYGDANGQTEFMEESRVGICDLIKCLKNFVEVENMECDFSAFEFANF